MLDSYYITNICRILIFFLIIGILVEFGKEVYYLCNRYYYIPNMNLFYGLVAYTPPYPHHVSRHLIFDVITENILVGLIIYFLCRLI